MMIHKKNRYEIQIRYSLLTLGLIVFLFTRNAYGYTYTITSTTQFETLLGSGSLNNGDSFYITVNVGSVTGTTKYFTLSGLTGLTFYGPACSDISPTDPNSWRFQESSVTSPSNNEKVFQYYDLTFSGCNDISFCGLAILYSHFKLSGTSDNISINNCVIQHTTETLLIDTSGSAYGSVSVTNVLTMFSPVFKLTTGSSAVFQKIHSRTCVPTDGTDQSGFDRVCSCIRKYDNIEFDVWDFQSATIDNVSNCGTMTGIQIAHLTSLKTLVIQNVHFKQTLDAIGMYGYSSNAMQSVTLKNIKVDGFASHAIFMMAIKPSLVTISNLFCTTSSLDIQIALIAVPTAINTAACVILGSDNNMLTYGPVSIENSVMEFTRRDDGITLTQVKNIKWVSVLYGGYSPAYIDIRKTNFTTVNNSTNLNTWAFTNSISSNALTRYLMTLSVSNAPLAISLTQNTFLSSPNGIEINAMRLATGFALQINQNVYTSASCETQSYKALQMSTTINDYLPTDGSSLQQNYWGHITGPHSPNAYRGIGSTVQDAFCIPNWCTTADCTQYVQQPCGSFVDLWPYYTDVQVSLQNCPSSMQTWSNMLIANTASCIGFCTQSNLDSTCINEASQPITCSSYLGVTPGSLTNSSNYVNCSDCAGSPQECVLDSKLYNCTDFVNCENCTYTYDSRCVQQNSIYNCSQFWPSECNLCVESNGTECLFSSMLSTCEIFLTSKYIHCSSCNTTYINETCIDGTHISVCDSFSFNSSILNPVNSSNLTLNNTLFENTTLSNNSTLDTNGTLAQNTTDLFNSTIPSNGTIGLNATEWLNSTNIVNETYTLNTTLATNATLNMNNTEISNSTLEVNATATVNETISMNNTVVTNNTIIINATLTANGTIAVNETTLLNGTEILNNTLTNNTTLLANETTALNGTDTLNSTISTNMTLVTNETGILNGTYTLNSTTLTNATLVTNETVILNGTDILNNTLTSNTTLLANETTLLNGTDTLNSTTLTNATLVTNETAILNTTETLNSTTLTNATLVTNETAILNGTDTLNSTTLINATLVTNETTLLNGTDTLNSTTLTNGTLLVNETTTLNGTNIINNTLISNSTLLSNVTNILNSTAETNTTLPMNGTTISNTTVILNTTLAENTTLFNDTVPQQNSTGLTNVTSVGNETSTYNQTLMGNTTFAENGTSFLNSTNVSNSSLLSNGTISENGTSILNYTIASNNTLISNNTVLQNNYTIADNSTVVYNNTLNTNITDIQNSTSLLTNNTVYQQNYTDLINSTDTLNATYLNSTITTNGTTLLNETMTANATSLLHNGTVTTNETISSNETLYQNQTDIINGTVVSNITMLSNTTLPQNNYTYTSNFTDILNSTGANYNTSTIDKNSTFIGNQTFSNNETISLNSTTTANLTLNGNGTLTYNESSTNNSTFISGNTTITNTTAQPNSTFIDYNNGTSNVTLQTNDTSWTNETHNITNPIDTPISNSTTDTNNTTIYPLCTLCVVLDSNPCKNLQGQITTCSMGVPDCISFCSSGIGGNCQNNSILTNCASFNSTIINNSQHDNSSTSNQLSAPADDTLLLFMKKDLVGIICLVALCILLAIATVWLIKCARKCQAERKLRKTKTEDLIASNAPVPQASVAPGERTEAFERQEPIILEQPHANVNRIRLPALPKIPKPPTLPHVPDHPPNNESLLESDSSSTSSNVSSNTFISESSEENMKPLLQGRSWKNVPDYKSTENTVPRIAPLRLPHVSEDSAVLFGKKTFEEQITYEPIILSGSHETQRLSLPQEFLDPEDEECVNSTPKLLLTAKETTTKKQQSRLSNSSSTSAGSELESCSSVDTCEPVYSPVVAHVRDKVPTLNLSHMKPKPPQMPIPLGENKELFVRSRKMYTESNTATNEDNSQTTFKKPEMPIPPTPEQSFSSKLISKINQYNRNKYENENKPFHVSQGQSIGYHTDLLKRIRGSSIVPNEDVDTTFEKLHKNL